MFGLIFHLIDWHLFFVHVLETETMGWTSAVVAIGHSKIAVPEDLFLSQDEVVKNWKFVRLSKTEMNSL